MNFTCAVPADVPEAVEPSLCVLAWTRRVEAPLARLIEQRSIIISIVRVIQLHIHHTAGRTVPLSVLLLVEYQNDMLKPLWRSNGGFPPQELSPGTLGQYWVSFHHRNKDQTKVLCKITPPPTKTMHVR